MRAEFLLMAGYTLLARSKTDVLIQKLENDSHREILGV